MKKRVLLCISFLLLVPNQTKPTHNVLFLLTGIGLSITGLYGLYRLTKKQHQFNPTPASLNTLTFCQTAQSIAARSAHILDLPDLIQHVANSTVPEQTHLTLANKKHINVHRGIHIDQDEKLIFLSSRGYAKRTTLLKDDERELVKSGGCAIAARILMQDNIVHNHPVITFDYPDDKDTFSFGQDTDYECLTSIWNTVSRQYPNAAIVGVGDCRGARSLLELATTQPKNLRALILFSPYISSRDLTEQVAQNHLSWLPGSKLLLHTFFKAYFTNYNPENDTLANRLDQIDTRIPIFIGHRKHDHLVSEKSMQHLLRALKNNGHNDVYFFVVKDNMATHSRISHIPELQHAINAFLARYDLPHNKELAQKGDGWLKRAHDAAQKSDLNVVIRYS